MKPLDGFHALHDRIVQLYRALLERHDATTCARCARTQETA